MNDVFPNKSLAFHLGHHHLASITNWLRQTLTSFKKVFSFNFDKIVQVGIAAIILLFLLVVRCHDLEKKVLTSCSKMPKLAHVRENAL